MRDTLGAPLPLRKLGNLKPFDSAMHLHYAGAASIESREPGRMNTGLPSSRGVWVPGFAVTPRIRIGRKTPGATAVRPLFPLTR